LFEGLWADARQWCDSYKLKDSEGYVVRSAGVFTIQDFQLNVAKYVRKDHVTTDRFWRNAPLVKNEVVC
jgi:hypothetical protein